jgi:hypothetical protein
MMGSQTSGQERLFYSFNIEDHIPSSHLLRGIDRFLDLDSLRRHLAPFYSHTGRPSIGSRIAASSASRRTRMPFEQAPGPPFMYDEHA